MKIYKYITGICTFLCAGVMFSAGRLHGQEEDVGKRVAPAVSLVDTVEADEQAAAGQPTDKPGKQSVSPNATISMKSGKTQVVRGSGMVYWVSVEDVSAGALQMGAHSTSGESPQIDVFEAAEMVDTSEPLTPQTTNGLFSPQGLGETALANYDIPHDGRYYVRLSQQEGQVGEMLLLVGHPASEQKNTGGTSGVDDTDSSTTVTRKGETTGVVIAPLFLQVLIVALILCLAVMVGCIGHYLLLRESSATEDDSPDSQAYDSTNVRFELDIHADGQSDRIPLDLVHLARTPLIIGRSSSCGIELEDAQVSSSHAQFCVRNGVLVLIDRDSTNGTYVNGKRIAPNKPFPLHGGESISIASARIRIVKHRI